VTTTRTGSPSGGGPVRVQVTGRIDIASEGDVAHWLKVFDTSRAELLAAVAAVGTDAAAVSSHLGRGSGEKPTPVPQIPDGG
jgi:hypothetical protein